jgi:hypothetical protein
VILNTCNSKPDNAKILMGVVFTSQVQSRC